MCVAHKALLLLVPLEFIKAHINEKMFQNGQRLFNNIVLDLKKKLQEFS